MAQKSTHSSGPVVIVDDSLMDATIAERVYERSRLQNPLRILRSGSDFIHYMQRVEAGEEPHPALVFMDIHMEGQTGIETVRQLRNHPRFRSQPPVVMLTNDDDRSSRETALAVGADRYALKPSKPSDFVAFFDSFHSSQDS